MQTNENNPLLSEVDFSVPSLRQVWSDYQKSRKLKQTTIRNYNQRLNGYLADWLDLPVTELSKNMIEDRHRSIKGDATANSTMRTLKALIHYAAKRYETANGEPIIKTNPVYRLSEVRAWHKDRRRTTLVRMQQLRPWFQAVFALENHTSRDFLLLLIFTGMRKGEAANLKWQYVDLESGIITIPSHLTKTDEEYVFPLSDYVWTLLKLRRFYTQSEWVFPGAFKDRPTSGAFNSYYTVVERSGVKFSPHDLRRSFVTIADELEIKSEVVKALVNHKSSDVTEGYTVRSIERLRRATQRITDAILFHAGINKTILVRNQRL